MEESNNKKYRNLITILKLFQNRPYHLAKYLIESDALSDDFLNKIENSEKLNNLSADEEASSLKAINFIDVSHMKDFFNSLTDDVYEKKLIKERNKTQILNDKLDKCIKEERYEDAIRLRDFMLKNGIDRKKEE